MANMRPYWVLEETDHRLLADICKGSECRAPAECQDMVPTYAASDLCDTCHGLDHEDAFSPSGGISTWFENSSRPLNAVLRGWDPLELQCPLCRFFSEMRVNILKPSIAEPQFELRFVKITDAFNVKRRSNEKMSKRVRNLWKEPPEPGNAMLFILPSGWLMPHLTQEETIISSGCRMPFSIVLLAGFMAA